jgi:uroporphyrinogen-III decarboxylase
MTDRERMLAAIRGEPVDCIPFVPRLEFWYRARKRNGALPSELSGLTLPEIVERLGIGHYAVVPDFTDVRDETHMIDRALGLFQLPTLAYEYALEGVERNVTRTDRETTVEYRTPAGSIRTVFSFTEAMLDAGASMPWTTAEPIREPADFDALRYIFANIRVRPRPEGYFEVRRRVGERGLAIGYTLGTACPMQHIMKELMTTERFFYALADYPEKVHELAKAMEPFYESMKRIVADSPAEVVLLGGNYDDSITYPAFFREHILPALKRYAEELHQRGKYLLTHTDGENRRLMPLYLEAGFDVADSVCPYPMTSLRLEDILDAFRGRITVLGGIPSVLLCEGSASFEEFRRFVDDLLQRHGRDTRLILGVSDMVTADCEWDRLEYISERVRSLR